MITDLLRRVEAGDREAHAALVEQIHGVLGRMAHARAQEQPKAATLDTVGLVNDAYVKVLGQSRPGFENRRHLFGAFARAMHEVLIDAARKRRAAKRGGGARPVAIDMVQVAAPMHGVQALDLAEAIPALEADDPRAAEIVRLKCLAGLTDAMLADVLGVSERTVQRDWTYAKAFIRRHLAEAGSEEA